MPALLHPGVYVLEVPSGVRTIEGVPTSTTIFVGETERGPTGVVKIRGRTEYAKLFGGYLRHGTNPAPVSAGHVAGQRVTMAYAMDQFFQNGGTTAYILRAVAGDPEGGATVGGLLDTSGSLGRASRDVVVGGAAVAGFAIEAVGAGVWGNDVFVVVFNSSDNAADRFRLGVFYRNLENDDFTPVEVWDRLSVVPGDEGFVRDVLRRSNFVRWVQQDEDAVLAGPLDVEFDFTDATDNPSGYRNPTQFTNADVVARTTSRLDGGAGGAAPLAPGAYDGLLAELDGVDDAALIVCGSELWLSTTAPAGFEGELYDEFRTYADLRPKQDLLYVADLPRNGNGSPGAAVQAVTAHVLGMSLSTFAAVYWPHVRMADPVGVGKNPTVVVPPAALATGVYSRTDGRRGVWKAPAGVEATINGIVGLEYELLDAHQDDLNILGINALRRIPGAGSVVWGSRTTRPTTEWRYVPVRRTAMFLRKSIHNGIQWAVFEPNGQDLWQSLRATIGAFMETQFRAGAFAGATAREAYFVKCDEETTTEIDQANGVVNILVGFAPLRPAEFVVVQLSQMTGLTA